MVKGCGASLAKIILFVVNALVWVASIILVAIGGYVLNNSSTYSDLFGEDTNTLTVVCGVILAVGCFVFLLGFLGCCGACMENPCFLKMYFTFLLILVVVEFVGGILAFVYRGDIQDFLDKQLYEQVTENYGMPDQKVVTETIDSLQESEKCCGARNYTDYYNSKFSDLPEYEGEAVPLSCCKDETPDCNKKAGNVIANEDNIYTKGCITTLVDFFEDNFVYIGVAALILIGVEITAMFMACCLICGINNKKDYNEYA